MKITSLLPLFLFFQINVIGQSVEFPTENARWTYDYQEYATTLEKRISTFIGDSIYNNKSYKILRHDDEYWSDTISLLRVEDKRVYFVPPADTTEYVLYDFSLEVGDTFSLGYFNDPNFNFPDSIVISDIFIYQTNDGPRKQWIFNAETTWLEGIGTTHGDVVFPHYVSPQNYGQILTCFAKDSVDIIGEDCYNLNVSVPNGPEFSIPKITVFPNPFEDQFLIKLDPNYNLEEVSLFDIQGNEIPHKIEGQQLFLTAHLPKGVYYLKCLVNGHVLYKALIRS